MKVGLLTQWCFISLFWIKTATSTRYYIVVPGNLTSNTNITSAVFKQRQTRDGKIPWKCPDGRNPIVYKVDDTYKIQAKSIDISTAHSHEGGSPDAVNCIGLNVRVVQKQVQYVWGEQNSSGDKKSNLQCFGYLTKTDKLEYDELIERDTVTIEFELSPPTEFEVYSVKPSLECTKKTLIAIKPPTVAFHSYDPSTLKPDLCIVSSPDLDYLVCNMSLLAQFVNKSDQQTFAVVSKQTQITVPGFIWDFRPVNIVCKSICELSTESDVIEQPVQIASERYTAQYSQITEGYQYQISRNDEFYMISSYVFGCLLFVCIIIIISLMVRIHAARNRLSQSRNTRVSQIQHTIPYIDAGGYSRIMRHGSHRISSYGPDTDRSVSYISEPDRSISYLPKTHCSLPPTPCINYDNDIMLRSRDCTQYNAVSLKLTECMDIHNVNHVRNNNKVYEKLTI